MDIPKELKEEYSRTIDIINGFIRWLSFCVLDTQRNPEYVDNHLLHFLADDYLESVGITPYLVRQGVHRPVYREARFLLEMSIKMAYIQQKDYNLPSIKKIKHFKKVLKSPKITLMRDVDLNLLKDELKISFLEECGRLFGFSSNFIHLTSGQILSRIKLIEAGRSIGNESPEDLEELNDFLERIYAISIVFMMHSVPSYIAGDWLVEKDGSTIDWYFIKSKYIAAIDEKFDYKHERRERLNEIAEARAINIRF